MFVAKPRPGRGPELLRFGQRRCAGRWASVTGGLLVRIANLDQRRFTPRPAENLQAGRQVPADKAHRDGDGGKPGGRRKPGAVVAVRRVEVADHICRAAAAARPGGRTGARTSNTRRRGSARQDVKHFRDVPDRLMQTTSPAMFQLAGGRSMRKVSATLAALAVLAAGVGTYVFD